MKMKKCHDTLNTSFYKLCSLILAIFWGCVKFFDKGTGIQVIKRYSQMQQLQQ